MLLLEVLRRAAHDWVLYRDSTRLHQKALAEEAYHWLFLEEPGTEAWARRQQEGNGFTSFHNICEILSIDPAHVRAYVMRLDIKKILSTGRPPTYRRLRETPQRSPSRPHLVSVPCTLVSPILPPAPPTVIVLSRPQLLTDVPRLRNLFSIAQRTVDTLCQHLA